MTPKNYCDAMSDAFVPLAAFLSPAAAAAADPVLSGPALEESLVTFPPCGSDAVNESAAALSAVRRFRAAVADAIDVAVRQMLGEIAENVLARELELRPADIGAIVAKARERFEKEKILVVRIHPQDRAALGKLEVDSVLDESLTRGDVVAELNSGTIDLRLRARLEHALVVCIP
jgi:Flagellar assembly protein FliH